MASLSSSDGMTLSWTCVVVLCAFGIGVRSDFCRDYIVSGWEGVTTNNLKMRYPTGSYYYTSALRLYSTTSYYISSKNPTDYIQYYTSLSPYKTINYFKIRTRLSVTFKIKYSTASGSYYLKSGVSTQYFGHSGTSSIRTHTPASPLTGISAIWIIITSHNQVEEDMPDPWYFQFDLEGCNTPQASSLSYERDIRTFEFLPVTVANLSPGSSLGQSVASPRECGELCMDDTTCQSFSLNITDGHCIGYTKSVYGNYNQESTPEFMHTRVEFFYSNTIPHQELGYRTEVSLSLRYRLYTVKMTHTQAEQQCNSDHAELVSIRTAEQLTFLRNVITANSFLDYESRYHVGGSKVGATWMYFGTMVIPSSLWVYSGSEACVVLRSDGLATYSCTSNRYFICAY